jgi:peptidoglycan/xylan/chitin deacetylase (PgdA/CDA1 family)
METVYFNLSIDCEATQPAVNDPELGRAAVTGLAELLDGLNFRATFLVIPTDIEANSQLYRDVKKLGHEVGLHLHPAAQGYQEFLGVYDVAMQKKIISEAADRFAKVMGYTPTAFCPGYGSANDFTYGVLEELGFTHGLCSIPGRILPECASLWAGAPLFIHYANICNRMLSGTMNFVEIPATIDWESMMWGGKHPQDLRVELVDAKNHFYTIQKSLNRQINEKIPLKIIHAATHNTFDYSNKADFRRQTLEGIIKHSRSIAQKAGMEIVGTTMEDIAAKYRQLVKPQSGELKLDRRGYVK